MHPEANQGSVCGGGRWGGVADVISLPLNFSTVKCDAIQLVVRQIVILITKLNENGVILG